MLRKHKIKHRGMMMELASWLVLTKMTGLMANRAGNEPSWSFRNHYGPFPCWKCLLAHDCGNFPNLRFQLYYLVLREMGRHPGALVVHHAVEFEGEDAGLVGWSSAEIKTQMSNWNTIYFLYLLCCCALLTADLSVMQICSAAGGPATGNISFGTSCIRITALKQTHQIFCRCKQ